METVLVLLAILAVLTATVWIVAAPLRGARGFHEAAQTEREALEAAKGESATQGTGGGGSLSGQPDQQGS